MSDKNQSRVMFLGHFSFSKNNREGYGYNFVEFFISKDGERSARAKTIFAESELDVSGLVPGDIVNCKFGEASSLGAKAPLIGINVIEESKVFKR